MMDETELDQISKLDEAALLREAARLLGVVETDRSHLEAKLLVYTSNADRMIQDLHTRLMESQERCKELELSLISADEQVETMREELAAQANDYEARIIELEARWNIAVREQEAKASYITCTLNQSLIA